MLYNIRTFIIKLFIINFYSTLNVFIENQNKEKCFNCDVEHLERVIIYNINFYYLFYKRVVKIDYIINQWYVPLLRLLIRYVSPIINDYFIRKSNNTKKIAD